MPPSPSPPMAPCSPWPASPTIILSRVIIRSQGPNSKLKQLVGVDLKGQLSLLLYLAGIALCFVNPMISTVLYALVALMWFVPDRRIEAPLTRD